MPTGTIVSPGFVDTHRHTWQTQLRGVAAEWTLYDYVLHMRMVYGSLYTADDAYLGNHGGALEALDAGITTLVDHSHIINSPAHADEALRGLVDSGIRAVFCYGLYPNPRTSIRSRSTSIRRGGWTTPRASVASGWRRTRVAFASGSRRPSRRPCPFAQIETRARAGARARRAPRLLPRRDGALGSRRAHRRELGCRRASRRRSSLRSRLDA